MSSARSSANWPAEADEVDGQIADLLDRAGKGEDASAALREVLDSREAAGCSPGG